MVSISSIIILWTNIIIKVFFELIVLFGLRIICSFMLPTMSRLVGDSISSFRSITHIKAVYVNGVVACSISAIIARVLIVVISYVGLVFKLEIFCDAIAEILYSLFLFDLRKVVPVVLFKCTQIFTSFTAYI